MAGFDPARDVKNAALILEPAAEWPNFHDSVVLNLRLDAGDIRPEDNVWIGARIDVTLQLNALEHPFIAVLRFHDCDNIRLDNFGTANDVYDLRFSLRDRGFYLDGVTPLPPHIHVEFVACPPPSAFSLQFDCFAVEAVERRGTGLSACRSP